MKANALVQKNAGSDPRANVMVTQLGARRHYAVPLAFHAQRLLHRFCTDLLVRNGGWQRLLRGAGALLGSTSLRRLADREPGLELPPTLTRTFPLFGLKYKWRGQRAASAEQRTANWIWGGRTFATACARLIDPATHAVYAFSSAARELFVAARDQGASRWLDHATAPRAFEVGLIQEEASRFPGWSSRSVEDHLIDEYQERQRAELELASLVVCGSTFAKKAVEAEGVPSERVLAVPLGVADHLYAIHSQQPNQRRTGFRVLYVGGDGLRKGIGYLAQALKRLSAYNIEAKAAGDLELSEHASQSLARQMQLLGTVPRSRMPELFRWADVLVLPSISDTFGMVILEAMAAGLPVVATENTGAPDVIREGLDGFVIPIRDADAIATCLERLASNPELLREMGESARARAAEFTVSRYGERLMQALCPALQTECNPAVNDLHQEAAV